MQWDLFCRVVDNFGDIGVCWRLSADLASRGERVRLWADDTTALAWMAPDGADGVEVRGWHADVDVAPPADVVIEAFGCDPPRAFAERMAARPKAPVWINLEYLSAEATVDRLHGLPSPQLSGPGKGLTKWFYYPGFTSTSGGLIHEPAAAAERDRFDAAGWLQARGGVEARDGEQRISLFCYDNPALPALLETLAEVPCLLLVTGGATADRVQQQLGPTGTRGAMRVVMLPWLTQTDFDSLLWSCDLNFVRGEDSFVRAQWAGRPFVWQIYPQHDGAHAAKLNVFLDRFLNAAADDLSSDVRRLWHAWNGLTSQPPRLPSAPGWHAHCLSWRRQLQAQPDLAWRLLRFVAERR